MPVYIHINFGRFRPDTFAKFKDALQLISPVLPKKAINNAVKDSCKRLQACV